MSIKKRIAKTIAIVLFIICIVLFYKCPIKLFFGIECPGCGMTRAFKNFLKGDFANAFKNNPLFPAFGIITAYEIYIIIFPDKKRISKKAEFIITAFSFLLLIFIWLLKILKV